MNELNQFLKDTEQDGKGFDILEQPMNPTGGAPEGEPQSGPTGATGEGEPDDNDDEFTKKPRNRQERRLRQRLDDERRSSMQLAERLQIMSQAQQSLEDAEYLKGLERIYGNDTPEAQMATEILKKAFTGISKDIEERAYQRLVSEREQAEKAQKEAQAELEGFLDEIEDTYSVQLTEKQEKSFFELLSKMSPKDKQGNVTSYADPHAVWEVFQERSTKKTNDNSKAKNLVNRSMNQGGAPDNSKLQDDATFRLLRENGII